MVGPLPNRVARPESKCLRLRLFLLRRTGNTTPASSAGQAKRMVLPVSSTGLPPIVRRRHLFRMAFATAIAAAKPLWRSAVKLYANAVRRAKHLFRVASEEQSVAYAKATAEQSIAYAKASAERGLPSAFAIGFGLRRTAMPLEYFGIFDT